MPSSISNSDFPHHRSPRKNWVFVWGSTLVITGILVAGAEAFWRSRGHRPSIVDTPALWSFHREKVSDNNPKHVVLIGASRIQLGFSTDVFRTRYPDHQITQLAVDGRTPVATLRDLASDVRFRGTVMCSIFESGFERRHWDGQQEYVDFYSNQYSLHRNVDSIIGSFLQSHLVVLTPQVRLDRVLHVLLARDPLPSPIYLVTRHDRSRLADYSLLDMKVHRQHRIERLMTSTREKPPSSETWMGDVERIEKWVQQIANRGGQVVFIRFPTSDEHWEVDNERYPKSFYWDRMAKFTSAKTLHFMDAPPLTQFELPDTSHLDYRDSPTFTKYLLDELEKQNVLPAQ